jgi:hypothetical protein
MMEEEGANEGMLRKFSQKEAISWARRGSEIGKSFTLLMLIFEMRPQHLLLYAKRMVIRLGDGL